MFQTKEQRKRAVGMYTNERKTQRVNIVRGIRTHTGQATDSRNPLGR